MIFIGKLKSVTEVKVSFNSTSFNTTLIKKGDLSIETSEPADLIIENSSDEMAIQSVGVVDVTILVSMGKGSKEVTKTLIASGIERGSNEWKELRSKAYKEYNVAKLPRV